MNFDLHAQGSWLPILLSLLVFIYALFMPKKEIGWREFYVTFGIVGYFAWISDSLLGKMLDLVDFGHPKITGIGEFLSYSLIPSSMAVIYLNYLEKSNKWKLTIIFTIISTLIEERRLYETPWLEFLYLDSFVFYRICLFTTFHRKLIKCRSI
ncbi:hypothetical protein M3226_17265 [Neobacillus cucumis]|uniref:hypothetical protein n=1 Tax=Neobacillus cucumis TaxID=1740721 RepID=UPI00203D7688|nr:hypothetical protein [Neobacillus cucumis]MCM3727429.1 hypothetical protein [Neobacillus cucumis]